MYYIMAKREYHLKSSSSILLISLTGSMAHTRFMLLHDSCSEGGIKGFFQEVHELYIKVR
jgi:hypothetical protein